MGKEYVIEYVKRVWKRIKKQFSRSEKIKIYTYDEYKENKLNERYYPHLSLIVEIENEDDYQLMTFLFSVLL